MLNDPIVNEIRAIRRAHAEKFDNDLHALCEELRRQERESSREFRTPEDRRVIEGLRSRQPSDASPSAR